MAVSVQSIFPPGWQGYLDPMYPRLGLGLDLATTTKKKSNPACLALTQQVGLMYFVRLLVRFKTEDPDVTRSIISTALDLPHSLKAGRLCVDATNERFFATDLRKDLAGKIMVDLVISSEATTYLGERMLFKSYLGNLLVNAMTDGYLAIPDEEWLKKDLRQVVTSRGTFDADVDAEGNHADAFDAIKLSLHALQQGSGRAEAHATAVGHGTRGERPGIKNPLARIRRAIRNSC